MDPNSEKDPTKLRGGHGRISGLDDGDLNPLIEALATADIWSVFDIPNPHSTFVDAHGVVRYDPITGEKLDDLTAREGAD